MTFIHTTNPYEDSSSPQASRDVQLEPPSRPHTAPWQSSTTHASPYLTTRGSTHGLEALSAAASGDHYLQYLHHTGPLTELAQATAHEFNHIVHDEPSSLSPNIDPQLSNDLSNTAEVQGLLKLDILRVEDEIVKTDDDVPYLLRYFSEGPGAWMDLFDLNSFFAVDVPVKAASCPLLLYAAIALSAKALGRIRISAQYAKPMVSKQTPSQWLHKARYYYDLAIGLLRQALENGTRSVSATGVSSEVTRTPGPANGVTDAFSQWRDANSIRSTVLPSTDSDELVATTAILCVYEFLDASGLEWSRHLDGARSLFEIAAAGTLPLTAQWSESVVAPSSSSKGRRAVFWNICRQEMINACESNVRRQY